MSIRLITFDLDNTLWDSIEVLERATFQLNSWLEENQPEYLTIDDEVHREIRRELLASYPEVAYDVSASRIRHMEAAFLRLGHTTKQAYSSAIEAFKVFMYWRCQVEPYPGAEELLARLKDQYLLASITNGNSDITLTSIDQYFNWHINAAIASAAKPDAAIFQFTLERAGGISPQNTVHVGDSYQDDYVGAIKAGLHAILYDPDGRHEHESVEHSVRRLSEIPEKIQSLPIA